MKLKSSKGFTLIELVIVIIIIAILAVVSVPMYHNYVRKAMTAEAHAALGAICSAEKAYYAEHALSATPYYATAANPNTPVDDTMLGIDLTGNKYFGNYDVTTAAGPLFHADVPATNTPSYLNEDAKGITSEITVSPTSAGTFADSGL